MSTVALNYLPFTIAYDCAYTIMLITAGLEYYALLYQLREWIKRIHILELKDATYQFEEGSDYTAPDRSDGPTPEDDQRRQPLVVPDQLNATEVETERAETRQRSRSHGDLRLLPIAIAAMIADQRNTN